MAIAREIKFRAWHQYDKRMVYGPSDDVISPSWVLAMCSANNMEPMQYTGRKDKNGVEIYEDDIIIDEAGRYGLVYWNIDDCQFLVDFQADMEIEEISSYHVVCGNSWQNVELLK